MKVRGIKKIADPIVAKRDSFVDRPGRAVIYFEDRICAGIPSGNSPVFRCENKVCRCSGAGDLKIISAIKDDASRGTGSP